jgi:uncharacterized protein (DUF433 family)
MATATLDWSQCPAVESIPGKVGGAWVLRGTRMPVAAIFENIEAGGAGPPSPPNGVSERVPCATIH